jgi:hypothetical protein
MSTRDPILTIEKMVFVNLDEGGTPTAHGKTEITFVKDRLA